MADANNPPKSAYLHRNILTDPDGNQTEGVNKVAGYIWDTGSLAWVKQTASGGGGGGSVTQGTTPWIVAGAAGVGLATEATLAKIPGMALPIFDATGLSQTSLQDVWTFYTGGLLGTLVATVTIIYTDATKATIVSVVKT